MFRTTTNVTGTMTAATVLSRDDREAAAAATAAEETRVVAV
jgi:Na+/H+-dicarboxylate symporter